MNIVIVGLGNIGSYFYNFLKKNKDKLFNKTNTIPNIVYVSAKSIGKKRNIKIPKKLWLSNCISATKLNNVDVIVELIGGSDGVAKKLVFEALKNKKHVVTANKALVAKYGDQLAKIAERNKVNFEFEAAVCGGIPIIRSIKEGLIANNISKIYGILNGTSNYILSAMDKEKLEYKDALIKAQKLGFAESNPISDLNGNDVASKIRILSSISFNNKISKNKILTEGIQNILLDDIIHAKNLGFKIKLLAISEIVNNKLIERVHPCLISKNSYIANIDGVLNAIIIDGLPVGKSVIQGEGAGPGPTTSSLISDLCSILRGNIKYPFGVSSNYRKKVNQFNILKHVSSSYFRIEVKDKHGVLSSITKIFSKNKISVKNVIQIPNKKLKKASIIIITHETSEFNYQKLLINLEKNKFILRKPTFIRIEKI